MGAKTLLMAAVLLVAAAAAISVEDAAPENIQPLSTLNLAAAKVGMDSASAIYVSPDVLGKDYKFGNCEPDFLRTGSGNTSFLVINQRYNYAFGLFSGGKDNMAVTWTSGYNIGEAYPFVEWRIKGEETSKRTPAGTLTFTQGHLCGNPARGQGYRDPGFIHTAFLKDLWPNREYSYQIGHELQDGTVAWGKSSTFRASPFPGQASLQRVVVFGDMGLGARDGSSELDWFQPGAQVTIDRLIKDLPNYDAVFHIGDLSYANGFLAQWDQFTAQVEPIASKVPYMVASGNHERTYMDTGGFYNGNDSHGECGVPAETYFYVPAPAHRGKFWYAADYGMFRFCVADTEHDWRPGSEQHAFLDACFAGADRKHQPWLVFLAHRPLGYSSNDFYEQEGSFSEPMGRTLQPPVAEAPRRPRHLRPRPQLRADVPRVREHLHRQGQGRAGCLHGSFGRDDTRRGRDGRRQAQELRRRGVAAVERRQEPELRLRQAHRQRPLHDEVRVHPQRRPAPCTTRSTSPGTTGMSWPALSTAARLTP
ncbi:hypothetical protein ACQ4PT_042481 [Festuca glaucescens]